MRPATSCTRCRKKRIKCERDSKYGACNRCRVNGVECSHDLAPQLGERPLRPATEEQLPSGLAVEQIVDDYIRYIHDRPHSLFHEPTLRRATRGGTISKALLFAVCAFGCRFSKEAHIRRCNQKYFDDCKELFHADLETITIESLQTCILLANLFATQEQPASEALYFSMAQRMVQFLKVDHTGQLALGSPVDHEVMKRIRLSQYTADCWHSSSSGVALMQQNHYLPMEPTIDEHIFHSSSFGEDAFVDHSRTPGLWTYRTELATIFKKAGVFVAQVAEGSLSNTEADVRAERLVYELEDWQRALPSAIVFGTDNLDRHVRQGTGGSYIDLFLGFHYYSCLVYFPFLGRQPPTDSQQHPFVDRCRFHALKYASLLQITHSRPHCEAVHYTVGHMTVVVSSALLYFLLSDGEEAELAEIRAGLLSNFIVIEQLSSYWGKAGKWTRRLLVFHDALAAWSFSESYSMDRWMMRFLLEYGLPLDARNSPVRTRSSHSESRDTSTTPETATPDMMRALQALL